MSAEAKLAWATADAASSCFTESDRISVYTALGAGETYSAIVRILAITVQARHSLPAKLVSQLSTWLDSYAGDVNEPTIRSLLNGVGLRPRR